MADEPEGIPWPALVLDPARLETFVHVRSPSWLPWRKEEVQFGMLAPEETARQFAAWAEWLKALLGDDNGHQAAAGILVGIALLRKDDPIPVIFMNAIAGLLVAVEDEILTLRSRLPPSTG